MPRIAITQRVSTNFHGQPHDCLDQSWANFFVEAGLQMVVLPNLDGAAEPVGDYLTSLALDGLVLSGGNDIAGVEPGTSQPAGSEISIRRDTFERHAVRWAIDAEVPVLGICRGMQFLNVMLGGKIAKVAGHAGTRHDLRRGNSAGVWFAHLPELFNVNSFHNFAVRADGLAPGLQSVATDADGNIEAFCHAKGRLAAIMWHPERESPFRESDIRIFLSAFRPAC